MKKILMALAVGLFCGLAHADTGDIPLSSNFQENSGRPLDARITVADSTARLALTSVQVYNGMMVFQRSDSTNWQLQGSTFNWVNITSGSGSSNPAAPFNSVQYNSTGTFNGSPSFTTDGSSVTVSTVIVNGNETVGPYPTGESLAGKNENITIENTNSHGTFSDPENLTLYGSTNTRAACIGFHVLGEGSGLPGWAECRNNTALQFGIKSVTGGMNNVLEMDDVNGTTPQVTFDNPVYLGNASSLNSLAANIQQTSMTVTGKNGLGVNYNVNVGSMTGAGLTSCSGGSNAVTWNSSTNLFGCNTISGSGGGSSTLGVNFNGVSITSPTAQINFIGPGVSVVSNTSTATVTISSWTTPPGGSNTNVQFNNNGSFGGSNNFQWFGSSIQVTGTTVSSGTLIMNSGQELIFNDSTNAGLDFPGISNVGTPTNGVMEINSGHGLVLNGAGTNETADLILFKSDAVNHTYATFVIVSTNSHYSGFSSTSGISTDTIWSLPKADGTNGQALITNGNKNLSFSTISGGAASTLGVAQGQVLVSSPTALISVDSNTLGVALQGGGTAYITINTSSITAQGNFYSLSGLATSTGTLTTAVNNLGLSTGTLASQINTKINFSSITATQPAFWNSGTGVISVSGVSLSTGVAGQLPAASIAAGALGAGVIASSLTASGVSPGSYTNTNLTVNAEGQITTASNGSSGSGSGIVSPGTFTWTNNFGLALSTLTLSNATQRFTLTVTTSANGANEVSVDSNGLSNFEAIISTPNAFTLKNPSGNTIFAVDNSSVSALDNVLTVSSVTSGGTTLLTVQANGNVSVSALTSGQCVQTGTGGLLTVTGSACGPGGGGGSSVYPATATASFPFGLTASTMTYSTATVSGEIIFQDGTVITSTSTLGGGGGGSGTVNSAAANLNAYYASAGTAVSGDVNMQVWASSETHTGPGGLGVTYNVSGGSFTVSQSSISIATISESSGIVLVNPWPASVGVQQQSPSLSLQGQGWKTTATAASQEAGYNLFVNPVQSAAAPIPEWLLEATANNTLVTSAGLGGCGIISSSIPRLIMDGNITTNVCSGGSGAAGLGSGGANTVNLIANDGDVADWSTTGIRMTNTKFISWGSGASGTNAVPGDVALIRNAVGVLEVDSGTAGAFGQLYTSTFTAFGHIVSSGTTPAVSSCGGGTPSVIGTDTAGVITTGSGAPTACTLTFSRAFIVNAPICVCSPNAGVACGVTSSSNSSVTFTLGVTETSINYVCIGEKG